MQTEKKNFPSYRRECGWNALLPAQQRAPALEDDTSCDVAIVGAGYTGVAAARRWAALAPGDDVLLLDAHAPAEGNPGRNSGFLLEIALAHDADSTAVARMRRCNALLGATMADIVADVAASGVDCGLVRRGTYRAAAGERGRRALDGYRRFLDALELPGEALDAEALAERIGTRFYRAGLYSPHCWLAQPAALIRALLTRLPASVRYHEDTPVLGVEPAGNGFLLRTPRARVRARRVVLANNAFAKSLGIGRERLVAMYTYAGLTAPLPHEQLRHCGSDNEWGLLPAHRLGSTLRRTADGRLLIRSQYGYERERDNAQVAGQLAAALARRFPALAPFDFAHCWGGATGFTRNAAPLWGEVAPGLFVSAGCNGGGVVKGTLLGRLLAEEAHGGASEDVGALFGRASWMPPEPARKLAFRLIAAWERRRAAPEV